MHSARSAILDETAGSVPVMIMGSSAIKSSQ